MKIIERYVLRSFLASFFLAWLVLSFVLTIGLLVKITRLLIDGLPLKAVGQFLLVGLPETLTLTVPIALLVSALLVFSRLSADSEIAAMRACGVNLLHVIKWPALTGLVCTLLGIYLNNEIAPHSHEVGRNLRSLISVDVGLDLLEPGRMIGDFPNVTVYFDRKEGNWLHGLMVFDHTREGATREISAQKALVSTNGTDIVLEMSQVRVDPIDPDRPGVATAERFQHVIPNALQRRSYTRKEKDFSFNELQTAIRNLRDNTANLPKAVQRKLLSIHRTEFHVRLVYAFASICFVLVGAPLGIRSHRKESTVGMAISLAVALSYYLCVMLFESLDKFDWARPYVLIWLPVAVCGILVSYLVPKNL
ncbi:MAG: LptF/LptG family permease [Verrucomicrobiota bacterium]|jgi:lipopolysaccharide export LptBFGC system permease protein LptF|nr:LptF/LptG family permease [Verrucomicrobiota bacterium]